VHPQISSADPDIELHQKVPVVVKQTDMTCPWIHLTQDNTLRREFHILREYMFCDFKSHVQLSYSASFNPSVPELSAQCDMQQRGS
jgi:hypothetical protein